MRSSKQSYYYIYLIFNANSTLSKAFKQNQLVINYFKYNVYIKKSQYIE